MTMQSAARKRGRPTKNPKVQSSAEESQTLERFLGPTPLLYGEDEEGYKSFHDNFRKQIGPHDLVDEIYIRDVVDQTWEIHRLRQIRIGTMRKGQIQAVRQYLDFDQSISLNSSQRDLVRNKMKLNLESTLECLQKFGVPLADINARAFKNESEMLFQIDQNMTRLEVRRNFTFRELERRKSFFAKKIIQVVNAIEENENSRTISSPTPLAKEG